MEIRLIEISNISDLHVFLKELTELQTALDSITEEGFRHFADQIYAITVFKSKKIGYICTFLQKSKFFHLYSLQFLDLERFSIWEIKKPKP